MITFQVESWGSYYSDPRREALWWEHYLELEPAHQMEMPMGPDVGFYEAMEKVGALQVLTARDCGVLVGYCVMLVKRHTHYPTLCGFEDSYFLTRDARRGMTGVKLISQTLKLLRARGVKRSYWMTKKFASISRIFQMLGMVETDSVWVAKGD